MCTRIGLNKKVLNFVKKLKPELFDIEMEKSKEFAVYKAILKSVFKNHGLEKPTRFNKKNFMMNRKQMKLIAEDKDFKKMNKGYYQLFVYFFF